MPEFTRTSPRPSSPSPEEAVYAISPDAPRIAPLMTSPDVGAGPMPGKPDLTATKVIAGAGAAATSAVMGSFLGATGTVAGAALGSVVSMIGASVYQRYLDRTRETVRARVRLPGGRSVPVTEHVEIPAPRSTLQTAAPARVVVARTDLPAHRPGRRSARVAAAALLTFALAMLAVTGVEWLKGSTLTSGQGGTSVGRVLDGSDNGATRTAEPGPGSDAGSEVDPSSVERPTETRSPRPSSPAEVSRGRSTTRAPDRTTAEPTPPPTTLLPPPVDLGPAR